MGKPKEKSLKGLLLVISDSLLVFIIPCSEAEPEKHFRNKETECLSLPAQGAGRRVFEAHLYTR
jgi:hypothetical protein